MVDINLKETNVLSLAYLGDSVWEVVVREYFIKTGHKVDKLNKLSVNYVNAKGQSKIYLSVIDSMDNEYQAIAKRARNGRIKHFPKTCTVDEYRDATAFEAMIAALYVNNEMDKIREIFLNHVKGK